MRISALDLNLVKTALAYRSSIHKSSLCNKDAILESENIHPFGKEVKMVRALTIRPKLLTDTEKSEAEINYENGMTMIALADRYGCHYTTVGRILRKRGVEIRDRNPITI